MSRVECEKCQYPISHCLCEFLFTFKHKTKIVVLQHPTESKNKKNTVKLLKLVSNNLTILIGETFDSEKMKAVLGTNAALLFPTQSDLNNSKQKSDIDTLVVIDATWKKAKKLYLINPWLQKLPTISIQTDAPKQYGIRKTVIENGYSTIEACAFALQELEHKDTTALFTLLTNFKHQFTKKMPANVKQRYDVD